MKKLLILALCGMLAVPAVNVRAAEVNADSEQQNIMLLSESGEEKIVTPQEKAAEVADELNDYYIFLEFTNTEKSKANKVMKSAGEKLGYDFNDKTGKLEKTEQTTNSLVFSTVGMIEDYLGKMKTQLDACKTKETAPKEAAD